MAMDITDRYVNKKLLDKYQIEFRQTNVITDDIPSADLIVFTEVLEHYTVIFNRYLISYLMLLTQTDILFYLLH